VVQAATTALQATKAFSTAQYREGLESWTWLDFTGTNPLLASLFGDVFLAREDGVLWLDVVAGELTREWESVAAMEEALGSATVRDEFLRAGLALSAHRRGLTLGEQEIYDFTIPPVLGGLLAPENVGTIDFVVGLNLCGQIHAQARRRP
jgi:hypothetical protein